MARRRGSGGALLLGLAVLGGLFGLGKGSDPPKTSLPMTPVQTAYALQPVSTQVTPTAPLYTRASTAATSSAEPTRLVVSGHDVSLRSGPGPKTKILDRLRQGSEVLELERETGWVKVRHPVTGTDGWVKASLVRSKDSAPAEAPHKARKEIPPPKAPMVATSVIVARLLAESRASYPGNCACPDDVDKRGHRCGARSAYSRPGGYAPLCYPRDVTAEMIAEYRKTQTASVQ